MQCPKCHNECIDTQKFCTKCGNPLNFSTVSAPDEIPTQKQWESLGGGWNNAKNTNVAESVTVLRYPFFKDAEEQTVAVLGEKAIAADLEGKYSVPYAVLTQRYLYCKNETGNYVTEVADIEAVKDNWSPPGIGKFIMAMFLPTVMMLLPHLYSNIVFLLLAVACNVSTYYFRYRKQYDRTMVAFACNIGVFFVVMTSKNFFLCVLALILAFPFSKALWSYLKKPRTMSILAHGGKFEFQPENYAEMEFGDFFGKVSVACRSGVKRRGEFRHTCYSGNSKKWPIVLACVLVCILLVGIAVLFIQEYYATHCKVFGCGDESFRNGYCEYHYAEKIAHDAYDTIEGIWGS